VAQLASQMCVFTEVVQRSNIFFVIVKNKQPLIKIASELQLLLAEVRKEYRDLLCRLTNERTISW
jgi:hypothetical protein